MKIINVTANDDGKRLDAFLLKSFSSMPKAMLYKQIRKKNIKVNSKRTKPDYRIKCGDEISLYLKDEFLTESKKHFDFLNSSTELCIIYEDENIIIADKKIGLLCHPDGKEYVDTLIARIKRYLYENGEWNPESENSFSPALANRIDRNTGGLVIAAKNAQSLRILNEKIRDREIDKYYLTIVNGRPPKKEDTITGYLEKDERKNLVRVYEDEKPSRKKIVTKYKVLKTKNNLSLLEIELLTGRTHQIRAHLASIGCPLYGDGKYGKTKGRYRQALYSYKLKFNFLSDAGILSYLNQKEFTAENCEIEALFEKGEI